MKASKIIHRSVARIRVDFPYNQEMVSLLRQIADARWSKTLGAWHIPYTKEAFGQLKALFPDLEIEADADRIQQQYHERRGLHARLHDPLGIRACRERPARAPHRRHGQPEHGDRRTGSAGGRIY